MKIRHQLLTISHAAFVEAANGTRLLIDGGGLYSGNFDIGRYVVAPVILSKKVRTIDYVIVTHAHRDHAGGIEYILNNFKVRNFVTTTVSSLSRELQQLLAVARSNGIHVEYWKKGDTVVLDAKTNLYVLHPSAERPIDDPNNQSLVIRFTYGANGFLMTGDIDSSVEKELILSRSVLRTDVIKIPHHGSRYSNSPEFLRAVDPSLAVLSVGKGIRGLPSVDALRVYQLSSIPLLRTDRDGMVTVCSDGKSISYCTHNIWSTGFKEQ